MRTLRPALLTLLLLSAAIAGASPSGRYVGHTGALGRPCTVNFEAATDGVAVHVEVPRKNVLQPYWLSDSFTLNAFDVAEGEDARLELQSLPAEGSGDRHRVVLRFENGEPASVVSQAFFDIGEGPTQGQRLRCSSLKPAR